MRFIIYKLKVGKNSTKPIGENWNYILIRVLYQA